MNKIIIIGGATASGKSQFATDLAQKTDSIIINADSQQIYRETPIITNQPSVNECGVPHVLYGFLSAKEACSVARWLGYAKKEIDKALSEKKTPIVVGGTGLYLKCLTDGIAVIPEIAQNIRLRARETLQRIGNQSFHIMLNEHDPVMGEKLNPADSQRMLRAWEVLEQTNISIHEWQQKPNKKLFSKNQFTGYFINPPREKLYKKCDQRFLQMIENNVIDEIRNIMDIPHDLPAMKAVGIPELRKYILGELSLEEATSLAQQSTRRYAKRQITWFKNQFPEMKEINSTLSV